MSRRAFLALAGAGTLALVTGCRSLPTETPPPGTLPPTATTGLALPTPTAEPFGPLVRVTATDDLFVQSHDQEPQVRAAGWSLALDGVVEQPLNLTYDQVRALPADEVVWTLECIGNPVGGSLIGNAVWKGTRLAPLLAQVGVRPEAVEVRFHAADGYSTSVTLERLSHPDTLLVYEMNGYPLTREHGFPLRILIPGHYGQKMPKWLSRLEFVAEPYLGLYERTGWSNEATIRVNSRVERPVYGARLPAGQVELRGVAHAGLAGVGQVEVGISDSNGENTTWLGVELLRGPNVYSWVQWQAFWEATPGAYLVQAVATDGAGVRQAGDAPAFPNGSSGVHTVVVQIMAA